MKLRIAICDDSAADAAYVAGIAGEWLRQAHHAHDNQSIKSFPSAEAFLFHYEEDKNFDILLLDIEMKAMDGVALAKRIRKENETIQIIFITGYSEYISQGYEVAALHYLVKPVKAQKLFEILDRAAQKIQKNEKVLLLKLPGETVRVPVHEIRYLEVQQNYVTVCAKQAYTIKKTLGEFEKELDERFFRMGRSYLINLAYITKITRSEVFLSDNRVLPLPRGQYEKINQAFISGV